jgi:hypothetical protein
MVAVAQMTTEMSTLVPACTAPGLVRGWFTDDNDSFVQELARLATKVNRGDAPQPLCPSLQALETMPSQHALAAKIYAQQSKTLLNDRDLTREDRTFMRQYPIWVRFVAQRHPLPPTIQVCISSIQDDAAD